MNDFSHQTEQFLESILQGNRASASAIINKALTNKLKINDLYEHIIKTSLYRVGDMWENGSISVATEHLASAIVEAVLNELYYSLIYKTKNNKIIVATAVQNEAHQIGIKMVSDIFEMNGWNVHYLGANTPAGDLIEHIKLIKPSIIALSVSIDIHLNDLKTMIEHIKKEFKDMLIITGGQGLLKVKNNFMPEYPDVIYISDLYKLEDFINQLQPDITS